MQKLDNLELDVYPEAFHFLVKEFGLLATDLFASHLNHKVSVSSLLGLPSPLLIVCSIFVRHSTGSSDSPVRGKKALVL